MAVQGLAARYLLGEAMAFRRVEAQEAQFGTAENLLRQIAAAEVRSFKRGGTWQFAEDVSTLLRAKGIKPPRL